MPQTPAHGGFNVRGRLRSTMGRSPYKTRNRKGPRRRQRPVLDHVCLAPLQSQSSDGLWLTQLLPPLQSLRREVWPLNRFLHKEKWKRGPHNALVDVTLTYVDSSLQLSADLGQTRLWYTNFKTNSSNFLSTSTSGDLSLSFKLCLTHL